MWRYSSVPFASVIFEIKVSLTGIPPFAKAVAASSWIQILCNCIAGHYLIRRNIPAVLLVFGIQITTIAVAVTNRNWFLSLGGERKQSESDHAVTE